MSRPLRIEYPGAWYHVMNRGAGRAAIFDTDDDRHRFLRLLAILDERFAIETHSYCLMGNHYHLLLHTPEGKLSRGMRHLNGLYTQYLNRKRQTDGALFRGRYKSILVEDDIYLLQISRYIHRNPVGAGLVADPIAYPWSGCHAYAQASNQSSVVHTAYLLNMLGGSSRATQRHRYRAFIAEGIDEATETFYAKQRQSPVYGSDAFRDDVAAQTPDDADVPDLKRLRSKPTLAAIRAHVQQASKREGPIARQRQRDIALYLAQQYGYRLKEIARGFDLNHYATVSSAIRRLDVDDPQAVAVIRATKSEITRE